MQSTRGFEILVDSFEEDLDRQLDQARWELEHCDGCERCRQWVFGNGVSCAEHGE